MVLRPWNLARMIAERMVDTIVWIMWRHILAIHTISYTIFFSEHGHLVITSVARRFIDSDINKAVVSSHEKPKQLMV